MDELTKKMNLLKEEIISAAISHTGEQIESITKIAGPGFIYPQQIEVF